MKTRSTPHHAVIKATVERRPLPPAPKVDFVYPLPDESDHDAPIKDEEPGRYDYSLSDRPLRN